MLEQFAQLQDIPEGGALACFIAAQCLPEGSSADEVAVGVEHFDRLLSVYRQCRHAFHILSTSIEAHSGGDDGTGTLLPLSSKRWPTFREMFPGIKEDVVECYGPAAALRLSGKHIAMINRCLGNQDAAFTGAVERFLSSSFSDAWWWAGLTLVGRNRTAHPQQQMIHPAILCMDESLTTFKSTLCSLQPTLPEDTAAAGGACRSNAKGGRCG